MQKHYTQKQCLTTMAINSSIDIDVLITSKKSTCTTLLLVDPLFPPKLGERGSDPIVTKKVIIKSFFFLLIAPPSAVRKFSSAQELDPAFKQVFLAR
jgi:hypothetical protein